MKAIRYFLIKILGGVPAEYAIEFASQYARQAVVNNCNINNAINEMEILEELKEDYGEEYLN